MQHSDVKYHDTVHINGVSFTSYPEIYTPINGTEPKVEEILIVRCNDKFIGMMTPNKDGTSLLISNALGPEQIIKTFNTLEEAADLILHELLIHEL